MKIRLKDLARESGYSISTISRALNNVGKIRDKTREEILHVARRLDYPSSGIRGYEPGNDPLKIALVTDFHEGEFYASFFYGFFRAARREKIRLILHSVTEPRIEIIPFVSGLLKENYYDGIALFMTELEQDDYEKLDQCIPNHFPVVSNAMIRNPLLPTITFDGYSGGYQAAAHLYKLGYRNVGIVKGPSRKDESRFRFNGFFDYIQSKPDMNLVWEHEGSFDFDSGVQSYKALVKSGIKADAVFLTNDLMANAFIDRAKADGVRVPDDIAVIGYDDLPLCKQVTPNITSIRTDFERLGIATLRSFKTNTLRKEHERSILSFIPVSVAVRESAGKHISKPLLKNV